MALVKVEAQEEVIERLNIHYDIDHKESSEVAVFDVFAFPEFIRHVKDSNMDVEDVGLVSG